MGGTIHNCLGTDGVIHHQRFSGRREVALGLGAYAGYLVVRRMRWNDRGRARAAANARRLVRLERKLHVDFEPAVQRAAL